MAGKGKDLFVMLAERHRARNQAPTSRTERPVETRTSGGDGESSGGGPGELGATLGRWLHGALRTLRGSRREAPPQRPRTRPKKAAVRPVPRGLLLPGWMLAGMLLVALGTGFGLGQFTFGATSDDTLNKSAHAAETPERFMQPGQSGYLDEAASEEVLAKNCFIIGFFAPEEKTRAAFLAQQLRARGFRHTRVMAFESDGSIYSWATLCYVASYADKEAVYAKLQQHEQALKFEVDPELKKTPGWPD